MHLRFSVDSYYRWQHASLVADLHPFGETVLQNHRDVVRHLE